MTVFAIELMMGLGSLVINDYLLYSATKPYVWNPSDLIAWNVKKHASRNRLYSKAQVQL